MKDLSDIKTGRRSTGHLKRILKRESNGRINNWKIFFENATMMKIIAAFLDEYRKL